MAVTSVEEIWQGRDGEADSEGTRRYTRIFRVLTSSNYDTGAIVMAHIEVPKVGEVFPDDFGAWCQRVRPVQESFSPRVWLVTCSYSSERELEESPLDDPAEIEWDGEDYMRPAIFDRNDEPILNSAGDPFDPPVEIDDSWNVVTVKKNLLVVPSWILQYRKATNSDAFSVDGFEVDVGQAKMKKVAVGKVQQRNEISFRPVTLVMHLREEGWDEPVLDKGYREKKSGDATKRVAMTNDDGTKPSQQILLDGSGSKLANPSPSNAVYLEFELNRQLPFNVLPLS